MNKIKLILILLFIVCVTNAQTVKIGSTSYNTITEAITAANNGDVIEITGVHTEAITFGKSITLRGTDPTTDIIQEAASSSNDGSGVGVINVIRAEDTDVLTVTIENLGIRNGNSAENGGGINVDKVTGSLMLKNLIIESNYTAKNGGGLSLAGSNATVIDCTVKNNNSALEAGGILVAPNNAANTDVIVSIEQSLINNNNGRNGGGMFINGNKDFGDNFKLDVNITNSTVSNNTAFSPGSGNGGGAIWTRSTDYLGTGGGSNITLQLVHTTFYNNTHAAAAKNGLQFTKTSGTSSSTNFSIYNSIVVTADDVAQKALNFNNTNTTDVINCILGGLEGVSPFLGIIDDTAKNNTRGVTATFSGISSLSDEGGKTQVLAFAEGSNSDDYCTASTGLTLPTVDQRGYLREGTPDAGAFEVGGTLSLKNNTLYNISIYPNPAQKFINVSGIDGINTINIYSILGKLEKKAKDLNSIDVSNLSRGIYILQIVKDTETIEKKFIKL